MDVYLTRAAIQTLRLLALLSAPGGEGILVGHRRGSRRVVEMVLPTRRGFFSTLDRFARAERILGPRLVGFFSFKPGRAGLKKILAPFAAETVFLDLSGFGRDGGRPSAFVIDFQGTFRLQPVACVLEKEARRD